VIAVGGPAVSSCRSAGTIDVAVYVGEVLAPASLAVDVFIVVVNACVVRGGHHSVLVSPMVNVGRSLCKR
jgi:hypothetical protein